MDPVAAMRKLGHRKVRGSALGAWASLALVLLFSMQSFSAMAIPGGQSHAAPMAFGPMATYYPNHPRLLVRDVDWTGGLSVKDIRARCTIGSSWWNQCQRIPGVSYSGEREIAFYAFRYLLLSNGADADHVITLMKAAPTIVANGTLLADMALGFDWVYNYTSFSGADKTTVINKIDALATTVQNSLFTRHIWARDMAETGAVGLAGLALEGHHANADKYVGSAYQNATYIMAALDYSNGTWPEGLWYLNTQRLPHFLEFLEGYRTATEPSYDPFADIKNNQHDWLRKMLYFHIYNFMPYGESSRSGDTLTGQMKNYFRPNLDLMVSKTQDPAGAEFLGLLEATPSALPTYALAYVFKYVLWYDPTVPANGLKNLPKVMWFGPGTYDQVVMRTGWGPNDEVITFRSGDGFAAHQHLDSGSYTVTRGAPLLIDSGANATEGTDHHENYNTRTVAHDAINVRQDGEAFQCAYFGGWSANDGGQRVYALTTGWASTEVDAKLSTYLANKNAGAHFETGDIVALNVNPDYVYVQGNYTQAYNNLQFKVSKNAKVAMVTRQLVLFSPDWLIVKDRVFTTQSMYKTRDPLQVLTSPTINGTVFTWDEGGAPASDGDMITVENSGAHLFTRALFPEQKRIIDRTGPTRNYWADSTNRVNGAPADPMAGNGRVDIQDDTITMNHEFLNVMDIQPNGGKTAMPTVDKISETGVMGAWFNDTMVLFSRSDRNYRWASINTTETGTTKVHAFDIAPSTHYNILNLHRKTSTIDLMDGTSSQNGTLDFGVNLTGDNQIIIGWTLTGDLSVDSLTYSPARPNNGDNITLKAAIRNRSTYAFTLCNWDVDFYNGNPASGGVLFGSDRVDVWPLSMKTYNINVTLQWAVKAQQVFARLRGNTSCPFVDSDGSDNTQYAYIYINAKPVPVIVAPSWAWVNQVVQFDGSQSYDMEGTLQSKKWNWGDGSPEEAGTIPTHKYWKTGNYTVKFTVVDLNGVMNSTTHRITIKDLVRTPVPYFWLYLDPPGDVGNVTSTYVFNSTSMDPDHLVTDYKWDFGDGDMATGPNVTHKFFHDGFYNVSLTIYWNGTQNATAWWHWLKVADLPPHAVATVNGTAEFTTPKNEPLVFDASGTTDPDDTLQAHTLRWFFDENDPNDFQDGITVVHKYHKTGLYNVRLWVRDDMYLTDNATVKVTITNRPPRANISCGNFTLEWNQLLWVDGWRSSDPDSDTLKYTWDFDDNTTPSHNMIGKHIYTDSGVFKVTLTVTDEGGATDKASITVVQKAEPPPPPPPHPKDNKKWMYMAAAGVGIGVVVAAVAVVLLMRRKKAKEKAAREKAEQEAADAAAAQQAQMQAEQQAHGYYPQGQEQAADQQYYPQQYQDPSSYAQYPQDQSGNQQYPPEQGYQQNQNPTDQFQEVPKGQAFLQDPGGGQDHQEGQSPEDGQNDGRS